MGTDLPAIGPRGTPLKALRRVGPEQIARIALVASVEVPDARNISLPGATFRSPREAAFPVAGGGRAGYADRMSELTQLLEAAATGDRQAAADLLPLVYDELRRLAAHRLARESPGHTLQPTDLVHEAYLRLARQPRAPGPPSAGRAPVPRPRRGPPRPPPRRGAPPQEPPPARRGPGAGRVRRPGRPGPPAARGDPRPRRGPDPACRRAPRGRPRRGTALLRRPVDRGRRRGPRRVQGQRVPAVELRPGLAPVRGRRGGRPGLVTRDGFSETFPPGPSRDSVALPEVPPWPTRRTAVWARSLPPSRSP